MKLLLLAATAATQWWAQGNPTPDEQAALEWINRARSNPPATLAQLAAAAPSDPVLTQFFTAELPETPAQFLADLQAACALAQSNAEAFPRSAAIDTAPLVFYPLFQAQAHALAPGAPWPAAGSGATPLRNAMPSGPDAAFTGPDASGGTAQFGPFGSNFWEETQADLYAAAIGPREFVLSWLCDPGSGSPPPGFWVQGDPLPDLTLGHTRMAGIDITAPAADGSRTLTFVRGSMEFLTQSDLPYGPANTVFITGVAYRDQNGNGQYDSGEGLGGVTVTLDHGGWGAVTASAGGYAIPVAANSGPYTLTATFPGGAAQTAAVTVAADNVELDWVLPAAAGALPAQVAVPPGSPGATLVNVSTRGVVQSGPDALIAGFIVAGPAGSAKPVLIRGVGPSLQNFGIAANDCIPATQLQVYAGGAVIQSNAGWTSAADGGAAVAAAARQCGAFPLTAWSGGGGDSAVLADLAPGAYTAVVTPAPGLPAADAAGHLGLAEIYDLAPGGAATIVNLSSRGLAGTGAQTLILGATIGGSGDERVLLRAAGPALDAFGVGPVLPDPLLTLMIGGTAAASNDGWSQSAQTDQIGQLGAAVGAFPFANGSADAALVADVPPGTFSATVAAAPGTTPQGVALVEIYAAP